MNDPLVAKEKAPRDRRDNAHPAYRVITLRINPGQRARLRRRRVELSGSLARRPWLRRSALTPIVSHPPSCAPFAPGPLRPFLALMGALTPARSVAVVLGVFPATTRSAPARAGLPDSHTRPSGHSVSNHLRRSRLARARYPLAGRTETASPCGFFSP